MKQTFYDFLTVIVFVIFIWLVSSITLHLELRPIKKDIKQLNLQLKSNRDTNITARQDSILQTLLNQPDTFIITIEGGKPVVHRLWRNK